jgi:hypothetical protein
MVGTRNAHDRDQKSVQYVSRNTWREYILLEDLGIDGVIKLNWILKRPRSEVLDCIQLSQWRVLVNVVLNVLFPLKAANILSRWTTISFSKRI